MHTVGIVENRCGRLRGARLSVTLVLVLFSVGAACPTVPPDRDAGVADAGLPDAGAIVPDQECFVVAIDELGEVNIATGAYTPLQSLTKDGATLVSTSYKSAAALGRWLYFCDGSELGRLARVAPRTGEVSHVDVRCLNVANWENGLVFLREAPATNATELAFYAAVAIEEGFVVPDEVHPIDFSTEMVRW